ncbi:MAG: HD domain-containing protein [Bryobacteraceae bacterium]|nr:HD domain-containing protein [Bryobacteraceae bacterium]
MTLAEVPVRGSDLEARSTQVEEAVVLAARAQLEPVFGDRLAVVAVGGFGRRELFPHSDIDLLLLTSMAEPGAAEGDAVAHFLRELYDRGLAPSHSVRSIADCTTLDGSNVELSISLLSHRFLAGSAALYAQLAAALPAFFRSQRRAITAKLLKLTAERHARFQDTIYHLEPDIKESPGGLRDLHLIEWLGALRGSPFQEQLDQLKAARKFLYELRSRLHLRARRDDNKLTFDAQDDLFERPAEEMREYFRHARAIDRETRQTVALCDEPGGMLQSFLDWRSRLSNAEFTVSREQVLLRSPQTLTADPKLAMRLMQFVARHGFRLARDTERRVADLVRGGFAFPPLGLWRDLRDLLSLPHAARALRAMHETGLLKAALPEWSRIECLVTRDFYHRYTVDEHTLVTLENLEALAQSSDDDRRPFRELLGETPELYLLRLALLLHDIGKGGGTGNHEVESERISRVVLDRLGLEPQERDTVLYLVERHLDLSTLMRTRDLHDLDVVREAARSIGAVERLQLLTLMTFADISAVNPTALTPWRMTQLWSAYRSLHHELTRELDTDRITPEPDLNPDEAEFLDGFPARYRRLHTAAELDAHRALAGRAAETGLGIALEHPPGAWQVIVVTKDRRGLFADLAGTISSFGMNIVKAEAFGNRHGVVLDILRFTDPMRRLELVPEDAEDLRAVVERVVLGKESVERRLRSRPIPRPPSRKDRLEPVVGFDNNASARATLLEVVAEDRPGLLYDLARSIYEAGCNIEIVLVNTEAHKALDVFYVTSAGSRLSAALQESLRVRLLGVLGV